MREPTPAQAIRLTDQQTLHDTMIVGQQYIPLTANGYRCQTADLWRLLLAAAARRTTLEAVCADLTGAPDANTVFTTGHFYRNSISIGTKATGIGICSFRKCSNTRRPS